MRGANFWILIALAVASSFLFPLKVSADKKKTVYTNWHRSDGVEIDGAIYFLSHYTLYRPGKVIIPMFLKSKTQVFFSDMSLYRLSPAGTGQEAALEKVWSSRAELSEHEVDLQTCRYGRDGGRIFLQWTGDWDSENKRSLHPILEYDTARGSGRVLSADELPPEIELEYHAPYVTAESMVWLQGGGLPLEAWELPSPLTYSSSDPDFLSRVLVEQMEDREFRAAALEALDRKQDGARMRKILEKMEAEREKLSDRTYDEYYIHYTAMLQMSETLGSDRPSDIFTAAFDNDTELLKELIENGTDPNKADSLGRTPLMYAVFGSAPDTLRLLFEQGADARRETIYGQIAWFYAALSPLRPLYLELWER